MFRCFLLLAVLHTVVAQLRYCEVQGLCKLCLDRRYSYYRCRMQDDCRSDETCDEGFCCPNPQRPIIALQNETLSVKEDPFPLPQQLSSNELAQSNDVSAEKCPDGGDWSVRCAVDDHCQDKEVCAEGMCCKGCLHQRRMFLDKLAMGEVLGKPLPRCSDDGLTYNKKQCLAGTDKCWCVSSFGRRLRTVDGDCETRRRKESIEDRAARLRQQLRRNSSGSCGPARNGSCPRIRASSDITSGSCVCDEDCQQKEKCCVIDGVGLCTAPVSPQSMTLVCGANEQFSACHSPCQGSCEDPAVLPCPSPTCQPGCHCQPGFIRRDGSLHTPCVPRSACAAYDVTSHCADERRQYHGCGSACPISCSNRNMPRCHERCVAGCFCRIPYILENGDDPLHSRCVMPNECPLVPPIEPSPRAIPARDSVPRFPIVPNTQGFNPFLSFYPTPNTPTVLPNSNQCADSLKHYIGCGTKCPVGCNALSPSVSCSLQCVPGCFCHAPYVLLDANDPQSACVLPQNCPSSRAAQPSNCADPRKEWSSCGALDCARSCTNLLGRCGAGHCSPGCICREPYVLHDPLDPSSRCVLPSECERKCDDPMKEFVTCGSSCPMGCDNRHPRSCTPCQTGCYCKNGLVSLNSTDWMSSTCVRLEECPSFFEEVVQVTSTTTTTEEPTTTTESTTTTTTTAPETTTTTLPEPSPFTIARGLMIESAAKIFKSPDNSTLGLAGQCPSTTLDVGGRSCNHETDCPVEQRCCRALIASLGVSPQRCSCPDPLAVWSGCGSLCPEYCGQPAKPVCSSTCNPGCQCAPGYVRARNDITAPCIPREACQYSQNAAAAAAAASLDEPRAMMKEIPAPEDIAGPQLIAAAHLFGSNVSGRFSFTQMTPQTLKITGSLDGLSPGAHAIVVHQLGDVTRDCSRIGAPFMFRSRLDTPSLGDISGALLGPSTFSLVVDWPASDVIGRSIAIYRFSTAEWNERAHDERPLACATIGLANR